MSLRTILQIGKIKCIYTCVCIFFVLGLSLSCLAQELEEPRRWTHLPIGTNYVGGSYIYSDADIYSDPVLQIQDAKMKMNTWAFQYVRTFELFRRSARVDFTQCFQQGRWKGLVSGVPQSTKRSGLSDSLLRFAVDLYGAPPLERKEFAAYRAKVDVETIIGAALIVQLPTGQYYADKLINLGTNRFTFRPQIGVLHNSGKWSMDFTGTVWLYTDNDNFFNGSKLKQDPLYSGQADLVYTFRPGLWVSAGGGYFYGGESTVNGTEENDKRKSLAWALSLGYPVARRLGVKVAYLGNRTQRSIGQDSDSIALAFSFFW
jgi:hypothetical protein